MYQSYSSDRRGRSQRPYGSSFNRSSAPPRRGGGNHKQYINPAKFVRAAKPVTEAAYEPVNSFADFDLHPVIKSSLEAKGIKVPTPIQDQSIPYGLAGKDVIGIANTGTGKTIAFAVPVLDKLVKNRQNRVLIMAPTRELAQQIEAECRTLAKGSGLSSAVLVGGNPIGPQTRDLRSKPQIVIGTPGRIMDHVERRNLVLSTFNIVVLDEVDRMLDMGFVHAMKNILGQVASPRQSFFFSATLDDKIKTLIGDFSIDPVVVSVKSGETSDNVNQDVIKYTSSHEKMDKLHNLLVKDDVVKGLIFDDTQRSVERLHKELKDRGFKVELIHGGKSQGYRQRALRSFKTNEVQFLVATDVAARGIDIDNISHVINYTTPQSYEDYAHRIGRTGRAGKTGQAFTFIMSN
jgi:ATP-dependent RNA helicase RhlE